MPVRATDAVTSEFSFCLAQKSPERRKFSRIPAYRSEIVNTSSACGFELMMVLLTDPWDRYPLGRKLDAMRLSGKSFSCISVQFRSSTRGQDDKPLAPIPPHIPTSLIRNDLVTCLQLVVRQKELDAPYQLWDGLHYEGESRANCP